MSPGDLGELLKPFVFPRCTPALRRCVRANGGSMKSNNGCRTKDDFRTGASVLPFINGSVPAMRTCLESPLHSGGGDALELTQAQE